MKNQIKENLKNRDGLHIRTYFDDHINVTNIMMEVKNSAKLYPTKIKENNSVVNEPGL